jgi:hypothetical protein
MKTGDRVKLVSIPPDVRIRTICKPARSLRSALGRRLLSLEINKQQSKKKHRDANPFAAGRLHLWVVLRAGKKVANYLRTRITSESFSGRQ